MNNFFRLLPLLFLIVTVACSDKVDPRLDKKSFTKILDNNQFGASYSPLSMVQTADKGYLILGSRMISDSIFQGIYLAKVDEQGNFVKEIEVDPEYVHPIADLMEYEGDYYFFCMKVVDAHLAKVDADLNEVTFTEINGHTYPAAAAKDGNSFLLYNYNHVDKKSEISIINNSGSVLSTIGFGVAIGNGDNIDEQIIKHFLQGGRQYPVSVGRVPSGPFYFNGFYNHTLSLVFTDMAKEDPTGVVQGQNLNDGFNAVTPLPGNKFATARYNYGDNYFTPNATLSLSGNTSSDGGNIFPELVKNANVKIARVIINTKNVIVYGADTKSGQIGLFFYDEATGNFMTSEYLGFSNPFEIASIIQTEDEGLAVCGTTYMAGRFPRICIFKLSKEKLQSKLI